MYVFKSAAIHNQGISCETNTPLLHQIIHMEHTITEGTNYMYATPENVSLAFPDQLEFCGTIH